MLVALIAGDTDVTSNWRMNIMARGVRDDPVDTVLQANRTCGILDADRVRISFAPPPVSKETYTGTRCCSTRSYNTISKVSDPPSLKQNLNSTTERQRRDSVRSRRLIYNFAFPPLRKVVPHGATYCSAYNQRGTGIRVSEAASVNERYPLELTLTLE